MPPNVITATSPSSAMKRFQLASSALRDSGYTGVLAGGDGVLSPSFVTLAPASVLEGVRLTSGTVPLAEIDPKLEADFAKKMGKASGVYAAESMEATEVFLTCIAKGRRTRESVLECVKSHEEFSVTGKLISFGPYGDAVNGGIAGYEVRSGRIRYTGQVNGVFKSKSALNIDERFAWFQFKELKSRMPLAAPDKLSIKSTIKCSRKFLVRFVSGTSPKCPIGFITG